MLELSISFVDSCLSDGTCALIFLLGCIFGIAVIVILSLILNLKKRLSILDKRLSTFTEQSYKNNSNFHILHFKQTEALLSLHFTLHPVAPLPETREWAASPDLLKKLCEIILQEKPSIIVEAGSGISTLICAYCLQKLGKGKIIALEHDSHFAVEHNEWIVTHKLQDLAHVVYAPLKDTTAQNETWLWYDISYIKDIECIDLLFIDGPPADKIPLVRYPALPLLFNKLNAGAFIILDDANRPGEKAIVDRWSKEFTGLEIDYIPVEKGAYCIRTWRE